MRLDETPQFITEFPTASRSNVRLDAKKSQQASKVTIFEKDEDAESNLKN